MKKVKQILALVGVILLLCLYGATLILAITDNSGTMNAFFASVVATVIVPVLLWAYLFIYRLVRGDQDKTDDDTAHKDKAADSHTKE
ncbi:MAG: hypothetical protein MR016_00915 [Agathobacter sp.]|nr:hypothetical protein [Agathobacter sp.]